MAATYPVTGDYDTTPSYSGTFIPTYWSGKLNAKFYASSTFSDVCNTDWEGEVSQKGDKVIITQAPSITINDYTAGSTLNSEVPTPSIIEMAVDQGKYFNVAVNDVLGYQADKDLMNMFTDDASEQLKVAIDSDCWFATFNGGASANKGSSAGLISGSYDLGTDTAPIALDGTNILEKVLSLASVLDEQNVPESDRWLVMSPADRQILLQSNIAQAYITGDSTSPMRNGKLGMLDRFTLYVSNLLPKANIDEDWDGTANTGTAKRHAVVAGHKSALTFASQIVKTETLRNPSDFGELVRGLNVYGRTVAKPEALALLTAAG